MSDSDYKPIPVKVAAEISRGFEKSIVVILAYDKVHGLTHVTTFGESASDKVAAASAGDAIIPLLNLDEGRTRGYEDFRQLDLATEREKYDAMKNRVYDLLALMLTCKKSNTSDWMRYLAEEMNKHLESIDDSDRVVFANGEIFKK